MLHHPAHCHRSRSHEDKEADSCQHGPSSTGSSSATPSSATPSSTGSNSTVPSSIAPSSAAASAPTDLSKHAHFNPSPALPNPPQTLLSFMQPHQAEPCPSTTLTPHTCQPLQPIPPLPGPSSTPSKSENTAETLLEDSTPLSLPPKDKKPDPPLAARVWATKTQPVRVACWNVNSLRARWELFVEWIQSLNPDVVLLQETKVADHAFPHKAVTDLGYFCAFWGEGAYNGVAILSRWPLDDITRGPLVPHPLADEFSPNSFTGNTLFSHQAQPVPQARYLQAKTCHGHLCVASVYVPNGGQVDSPNYAYKLAFLDALQTHLSPYTRQPHCMVVAGDFNVAPSPADAYSHHLLANSLLCTQPERSHLQQLFLRGWTDSLYPLGMDSWAPEILDAILENSEMQPSSPAPFSSRLHAKNPFTWWDYRLGRWNRDEGLRIDLALLSPWAQDRRLAAGIDTLWRDKPSPSDHCPIWVDLAVQVPE
jgi:exodeoxyribonuclease III